MQVFLFAWEERELQWKTKFCKNFTRKQTGKNFEFGILSNFYLFLGILFSFLEKVNNKEVTPVLRKLWE